MPEMRDPRGSVHAQMLAHGKVMEEKQLTIHRHTREALAQLPTSNRQPLVGEAACPTFANSKSTGSVDETGFHYCKQQVQLVTTD